MGRRRSADYEAKRRRILEVAAPLFARHGYDRTSLAMIGAAAGVAKSLVYHYYRDKDDVLADLLRRHLSELVVAVETAAAPDGRPPERRFTEMAVALLERYRHADAEHQVQIAHLKLLPPPVREELLELERRLVRLFTEALLAVVPELADDKRHLKPLVMSLFGMLNWAFLWFREDGPLDRRGYAELAARLVLDGARAIARERARAPLLAQAAS
ncbi:MAG: TetR/AcrR family transcriptional regulator [Geminicoccaceae bacterium]|nr:TetR/AcrR family transcriptional regulator [Geminicoccaceae bacterium]MCS7268858.1 TetR/AcrR family transcriptional regulator [Geminicoccaceae bacterium]MCX7630383.1 TetR/AcrR family transcriptional regulator [Geminicoccaceae bacterium]MDW8125235.1 TetR/AcrR family transcriptional regulator [Geminicoccaceae bacterium]MDW8341012.1 TetR/AcrR family transcriptional regulator [Geminicoccaceae bacterium]